MTRYVDTNINTHCFTHITIMSVIVKTKQSDTEETKCNSDPEESSDWKNETYESDDDGWFSDESQSIGVWIGQGCVWCMINHSDIPLFFLSFIVLYLSINRCCYCVMVVAIISAILCMRFPLLNATLWSSLIVLYLHKDWNLNFGNVKISWNRST